ncbi:porin [Bartonella sp. HY761]|uniref:porin n=1 Tax=Bartonella sp. HY761 TaxID=2979330 RepID=UPI00220089DD|nr:porin [Bartonella sp. HY761]UXN06486.1 porin [Bartonella sp. HY761]
MKPLKAILPATLLSIALLHNAEAQDAPTAEPIDYVRVCDAYGKGYYYIPGTETCMKISGYVRHEIAVGDDVGGETVSKAFGDQNDTYRSKTRAELKLETKSDTELGIMTTLISLRSEWKDGKDGSAGQLRRGYIDLAGVRIGLTETAFYEWTDGYGDVLTDDVIGPASHRTNAISYTYENKNGISAIIALEQGYGSESTGYQYSMDNTGKPFVSHAYALRQQIDDYTPHIVTGLKYSQKWGSIAGVAAYDSYYQEWAMRVRLNLQLTDKAFFWAMAAYKTADDYYNVDKSFGSNGIKTFADGSRRLGVYRQINSAYGDWGGDWAAWIGGTYDISKKLSFNYQAAYEDAGTFVTSANVKIKITSGLVLTPEIAYANFNDDYGYKTNDGLYRVQQSQKGRHAVAGIIRLQRSF